MASDLDFSPPEVPEPTFLENLLRYGLFLGAIFQLICVLAIIIPVPKSHEALVLFSSRLELVPSLQGLFSAHPAQGSGQECTVGQKELQH
ncbi:Protein MANBAL [Myotis brandtii]|uniref:Protein MANBAL n=1 Tax=Myotis brandtii TaxID=109478 RepID=S7PF93_MYOBR|nr:Protein MANBAL [Myotis brandtii]